MPLVMGGTLVRAVVAHVSLQHGATATSPTLCFALVDAVGFGVVCFCRQLVVISRSVFDPALPPEQHRQLQDEQLRPLQQLVLEAAAAYYTAASTRLRQKQLDLSATLGSCPPEISAAIAFKVSR